MKTYIDFPVVLERSGLSDKDWAEYVKSFADFEDNFIIWSERTDNKITIKSQKISLNESDMARFLEILEEFWENSSLDCNIHSIRYQSESDRIVVYPITFDDPESKRRLS